MMGSHRDSWVYGASDATSGTVAIMEIVRALGHFKQTLNWRPRRLVENCIHCRTKFFCAGPLY